MVFVLYISNISSGIGHIPLPICALPRKPVSKPISTFQFSYVLIHFLFFIAALVTIGPASMLVCISSPVLSRKPVFIKITLSFATSIHSFKFRVVLLSSSIIPILIVFFGRLNIVSISSNRSHVN